MDELKPCPFCGGKAFVVERMTGVVDVGCENPICFGWCCHEKDCDCRDGFATKEEAIIAWNTRSQDENL